MLGGDVIFTIEQPRESYCCSACGSEDVIGRGQTPRRFRTVPIGGKPTYLVLAVPRVECHCCGVVRQVAIAFADPRVTYTKAFQRYALELSQYMTIQDVADHLRISWDVIKDIQKTDLKRRFDRPKLKHLRQIAIDEISVAKGHVYLTIVMDLESGVVVHVGRGKGGDALKDFWIRLRHSGAKIEAVATDMSPAYIDAVTTHLRGARLVFDRFHVIKLYNDKLSELRRAMYRELTDTMQKNVLKGVRWLLLKREENLDPPRKREHERLQEALRLNQPLATAYYLKEDLRRFWEQPDKATAERFIDDWIARATASGITVLKKFAKTMTPYRSRTGCLVRPSDLHRPVGRHQQQDQDPPTPSLRLPRPGLLHLENLRPPSDKVRFSRMNLKNEE